MRIGRREHAGVRPTRAGAFALVVLAQGFLAATALAVDCDTLAGSLAFPDTEFTSSTPVAAGTLKVAGRDVPAHCRLLGRMHARVSPIDGRAYSIGFEMRLPLDWNRRFYYQANGGIDGSVATAMGATSGGGPLTSALMQRFAVISSDAGHNAAQNPVFGIDPQARLDYGYRAVGKLTPMAKAVLGAAYGSGPSRSYIGGCSNGGRHAMVAAARYPEDYDGYLVGAPGFNLPRAAVANIYGAQQYATIAAPGPSGAPDLAGAFTPAERSLLSAKVLERCDELDGLADGMVQDVRACQRAFDLARDVPTCAGARDGTCLSAAQKVAIGNIFAGPRDRAGKPMYSTFPYDAGHGAAGTAFWEFFAPLALDAGAVAFVFGTPPADPTSFNGARFALTSDIETLNASIYAHDGTYTESGMSFMTPPHPTHLHRLAQRGARMIVYHGVSDPIFSVDDTTRWFEALTPRGHPQARQERRDDRHGRHTDERGPPPVAFARLFHVPGMNHCAGGPSTDQFDLLGALVDWVENGRAPERVVATARSAGNPGGVNPELPATWAPNRTRPLCAYPKVATYRGGDPESAESFLCD